MTTDGVMIMKQNYHAKKNMTGPLMADFFVQKEFIDGRVTYILVSVDNERKRCVNFEPCKVGGGGVGDYTLEVFLVKNNCFEQ